MSEPKVYKVLADAFAAEEIGVQFTLMGNGNMYFLDALSRKPNIRTVHVRHENSAVSMACGYARSTGRVGVASVTNGPGITQITTDLTIAARARLPIVVFAGDAPLRHWSLHQIDIPSVVAVTGAHCIPVRTVDRLLEDVQEAFYTARYEGRPVVLTIPEDVLQQPFPHPFRYVPSKALLPRPQRPQPDPEMVEEAAAMIAGAERPIIIGGRGAVKSGAREAIEALAEQCGALLATSIPAHGLFDGNPFYIGVAGGISTHLAYELFNEADLVLSVGAGLGRHTTDAGKLFPKARRIQLDIDPQGLRQDGRVADLHIRADARAGVEALVAALRARGPARSGMRSPALAQRIAGEPADARQYPIAPGTVDPRAALLEIDRAVPKDWDIVSGPGHYFNFMMPHLSGRAPGRYHPVTDFGCIGSELSTAIGVACARGDGKVLLMVGDGSFMMHMQELDTIRRHEIPLLICILNDGGFGAEVHKFVSHKKDASQARHGYAPLQEVARAFGLRAETVTSLGQFDALFDAHEKGGGTTLWDVRISDNIPSIAYRRLHFKEP